MTVTHNYGTDYSIVTNAMESMPMFIFRSIPATDRYIRI